MKPEDIQAQIEKAYDIVKKTGITEEHLQLQAFKFALRAGTSLAPIQALFPGHTPKDDRNTEQQIGLAGIANALGISYEIVELFFDVVDGELALNLPPKVLPDSASAAMREIATLLAVGRKHAGLGVTTSFELIRSACDDNGKLDRKNFAAVMSQMKPKLVPSGKGSAKELVPKRPADDQAKELILKYNDMAR